ncbi:MAG TPA: hypothetical protein VMB52_01875 [Verrucomicrobiae bacterium]|nr:hypothetical protein [Verrucomicrobiae bacterium]
MKAKQLYFVLVGCCCLAFAAFIGVGLGANKLLGQQANKLAALRAQSAAVQSEQISLAEDKRDITKYGDLNTIAASVVPQDKNQAQAVQQIVNIAAASGIGKLSSITFPASTLGTTTAGASAKPGFTQLTPVKGISGVYNLAITITQTSDDSVPYTSFLSFLSGLEQNRRTAEVTSISVTPDAKNPSNVAFTLVINEFVKP